MVPEIHPGIIQTIQIYGGALYPRNTVLRGALGIEGQISALTCGMVLGRSRINPRIVWRSYIPKSGAPLGAYHPTGVHGAGHIREGRVLPSRAIEFEEHRGTHVTTTTGGEDKAVPKASLCPADPANKNAVARPRLKISNGVYPILGSEAGAITDNKTKNTVFDFHRSIAAGAKIDVDRAATNIRAYEIGGHHTLGMQAPKACQKEEQSEQLFHKLG